MPAKQGAVRSRCAQYEQPSFEASGLALTVGVETVLASESAAARLWGQLVEAVLCRSPVSLRIAGLDAGRYGPRLFEAFCERLAVAFQLAGASPAGIAISVPTPIVDPELAWRVRRSVLGEGELNLICDIGYIAARRTRADPGNDLFWQKLWRLRNSRSVATAFWPLVSSRCALFSAETATDVLPGRRLQAPPNSAWLSADVELLSYVDSTGRFDGAALEHDLNEVIDSGENLHDLHVWPTPAMQQDAWLHRRLAICLSGVGDLARQLRLDPDCHTSLRFLHQLLQRIRDIVQRRSRQLAQSNESLPGIVGTNPCRHFPAGIARTAWERRWLQAIERSAVRHRNLLVMSPWALFPTADTNAVADLRYMNFLPLLRHADACWFHRELSLDSWGLNEFKCFHQRAVAVMRSIQADRCVAEQL